METVTGCIIKNDGSAIDGGYYKFCRVRFKI